MLKRLLIGGVLGALAMFVTQGIIWGALPFANQIWRGLPNGEQLMQQLRDSGMPSGIYYFPERPSSELGAEEGKAAWERLTELARSGPTVTFMAYQAEGYDPMGTSWYVRGLVADLLACLLMTVLAGAVAAALPRFGQRVGLCVSAGLAGTLSGPVVFGGFYLFPAALTLLLLAEAIVCWAVAGCVIAAATRLAGSATSTGGQEDGSG